MAIITEITGGLGNQMFQYAVGRALSIQKKVPLLLDTSSFSTYSPHQGFELLKIFNCNPPEVDGAAIRKLLGWKAHSFIRRMVRKKREPFLRLKPKLLAIEPHFEYWQGIEELPNDCYLSGYWQSERYFINISEQIRNDFIFVKIPNVKNEELIERILNENSVSLHVRRGDYIDNPVNASIFNSCSISYYQDAIKFIEDCTPSPYFFIFSNDIPWVKCKLKTNFPVKYVEHNKGEDSYNDMRLMSLCKHNIIANSSFSWWGAWLNRSRNKIVIAPKNWFQPMSGINSIDLIPNDWMKL